MWLVVLVLCVLGCAATHAWAAPEASDAAASVDQANANATGEERVLSAEEIEGLFRQTLEERAPWGPKEMEIRDVISYPARVVVPQGKMTFEVEPSVATNYLGRVGFLVTVSVNDEVVRRIRIRGWVEVYRRVLCLDRSLRRGDVLTAQDVIAVERPLSKLKGQTYERTKEVVGMALRRSLAAGQVLTDQMLTPPIIVRRGDRVMILAQNPTLTVRVPGEARQNGAEGDMIRVRNTMSQRDVVARIRDRDTVVVDF